jgi:membrane fusion protein (multidrug efflux system)
MQRWVAGLVLAILNSSAGLAQQPAAAPPAVGVVAVVRKPVTRSSEYVGRIQSTDRVNLVARVAAFLEQRSFKEGEEVKNGDLLYRLEQGPFLADIKAKEAQIAQFKALLQNAAATFDRAKALLNTMVGLQSTYDSALASQESYRAQILGAEAQLEQARINLGYTEIRAPIDGKIGRTSVTTGNFVSPSSGVLAVIVSQDPMYVVFPVSSRAVMELRRRTTAKLESGSVIAKVRLPDGRIYGETGSLDFVDNVVAGNTDTISLRATLRNPLPKGDGAARELVDGELVTVILEDAQPIDALSVPRASVLSDQGGDYVFVLDGDNKVQQRRVRLGPSSPSNAAVVSGLSEGENVILEGIQRVRPGQLVSPGPASGSPMTPDAPSASKGAAASRG